MSCDGPVVYGSAMDRQSPPREPWEVRDNPERKRFEVDLGDACAIAEYTLPAGLIMFTHTEVPPDHGGKGIGTALIQAGLAAARERGVKVRATPPSTRPERLVRKFKAERDARRTAI